MATENPTVELPSTGEPAKGAVTPAVSAAPNVDELLVELEKAGVTNAAELQNKFKASSEVGRMAQLLGDERKRSRDLEDRLSQLSNKSADRSSEDPFAASTGGPIDIEAALERSVEKVLTKRELKAQQFQQANIEAWNQIQQDEDYHLIRPIWEEKLKDPNFVFKIQSGQTNPVNAYTEEVRKFYKQTVKKAADTIKTLRGNTPGSIVPPHVESGERTPANIVSTGPADERKTKLDNARKIVEKKGFLDDDEALSVIDSIFAPVAPPKK